MTAQRGDALELLRSQREACTRLVFFDPQHRENLDRLAYGNEGARQKERFLLPAMTTDYIDACCCEAARVVLPSGYLMLWTNAFGLMEGHHRRIADVLHGVSLIAWDNQRMGMGYRVRDRRLRDLGDVRHHPFNSRAGRRHQVLEAAVWSCDSWPSDDVDMDSFDIERGIGTSGVFAKSL
jgi:hypothetical protein